MKNLNFDKVLAVLGLVFFSSILKAAPVTNNEHQVVVDTVFKYFNGVANADQQLLSEAFDMEFGHIKMMQKDKDTGQETIRSVSLKDFAKNFKKPTDQEWKAKVLSLDIVDNKMAMVKLHFETPKSIYTDYLVLYKRNDQWRIINKTFATKDKIAKS